MTLFFVVFGNNQYLYLVYILKQKEKKIDMFHLCYVFENDKLARLGKMMTYYERTSYT